MGVNRIVDFNVENIEPVRLEGPADVVERNLMSPYVWLGQSGRFEMMVRAVPRRGETGDTGTIWHAIGDDGRRFTVEQTPAIVPGPRAEDLGGCEDPTVVRADDGRYIVYYTGVDASRSHGEMLYADGPSMKTLVKRGVAMASSPSEGNIKEATVDRTRDGRWRMFYEYAAQGASLIGLAIGSGDAGPWNHLEQPFAPRPDLWDRWHLSTGPMLTTDKNLPVMFYNGATEDARWRIGWIAFDAEYRRVVDRCLEPLISPPPMQDRLATDIAFAASVLVHDGVAWLYYSRADSMLFRARLRRS